MTITVDDPFTAAAGRSAQLEAEILEHPGRFRVLTGDRPTGALHLGHYLGTLANRVRLQAAGVDVFVVIADYRVIADRDGVGDLAANVRDLLLDYLAAGIDPARATIFTHSAVPALNQLMLPFLSLVTVAELHRNPTVKSEAEATGGRSRSGLMLTLWVPESRSPHAACEYSPIKPPRQSRLTTRLPARATGGWAGPNGGACPSERCGRCAL
jgi:tryptophanyl-tRNA synthetase